MLTYRRLARKPSAFKSITGISMSEFDALLDKVRPRYEALQQQRAQRPDRKRASGGGAKPRYDVAERLLMTMVWLRLYLTCEAVGILFDVDKSTVSRNTSPILLILRDLGMETLDWPEEAQALLTADAEESTLSDPPDAPGDSATSEPGQRSEASPRFAGPDQVAIIDATEQRVERSHEYATQKEHYSGKKKAHTRKTQIVVNEQGRIRHVSHSVPGSVHDLALFRQSQAKEKMPPGLTGMGDSGYQGMQDEMPERSVALPYRATRGHPLTAEQKLHNHEISRIRVVVENTLAELKHFRILADVFRHAVERYDSIFLAIAGVVNDRIRRRSAAVAGV